MNIIICDDDADVLESIQQICSEISGVNKIHTFSSSEKLKNLIIKTGAPGIGLFILDIEMPIVSGLELKDLIFKHCEYTSIVYLTDYPEYMQEAFGWKVIGFVDKTDALARLTYYVRMVVQQERDDHCVLITEKGLHIRLLIKRILYIQVYGNYTRIFYYRKYSEDPTLCNIVIHECKHTLKMWEETLNSDAFIRLNRGNLINMQYIDSIFNRVVLTDGTEFNIPGGQVKKVRKAYQDYIQNLSGPFLH